MGCGSSTRTAKSQNDNYGNDYDSRKQPVNTRNTGYYQDPWIDDNKHYGEDEWRNTDYNKTKAPSYQSTPQIEDENEDITPFDDDGVIDHERYSREDNGLLTKSLDFRTKFVDEKLDKRPQISSEKLFVDTEFTLKNAIVKDKKGVEWKRPKEFTEEPRLFTEGATRFDIGQGTAGTCWFLSIVTDIASNNELMKQVIPDGSYTIEDPDKYDGVFRARFFNFGRWQDYYIDDYLPVIYGTEFWGAKSASDKNELWVALLEKAFARMHGSYDAIYGGQPGDAYLQLTGGIGERVDLHDNKQEDNAKTLYSRIKNALGSGCQVSCLVLDEFDNYKGLVGGHAYSLVGVYEHKASNTKLLKLRNPWGQGEWKGAWSDGSSEWSTIPQNSVVAPNKDDGEFYVSLSDFMKHFSQTTICSLTPDFDCDGRSDSLNYVLSIYGEWTGKTAAGFHNLLQNQRFGFTVSEIGLVDNSYVPLVVQIIQQSKARKTDNVSIRCDIFKVLADKIQPGSRRIALEILGTKNNVYTPELQTVFRYKLKPGRYVIIASTADKNQEKAFLLRLFSPAPLENVKEIPLKADIVSCENQSTIAVKGRMYELSFEKSLFGEFITGKNAGGQVANRASYHQNPQYLITIPGTGSEVPLVIHIMQTHVEPMQPIGIRIFQLDNATRPPVDIKYLYDHYNNSPADIEGSQSKFMIAWNIDVNYLLRPGRYLALVHLDQPTMEKTYCIVFKSTVHVAIKGFQTG